MTRSKGYALTPGTYVTTSFAAWWKRLNAGLAKRGLPAYDRQAAHDAYVMGVTPACEVAEAEARRP